MYDSVSHKVRPLLSTRREEEALRLPIVLHLTALLLRVLRILVQLMPMILEHKFGSHFLAALEVLLADEVVDERLLLAVVLILQCPSLLQSRLRNKVWACGAFERAGLAS